MISLVSSDYSFLILTYVVNAKLSKKAAPSNPSERYGTSAGGTGGLKAGRLAYALCKAHRSSVNRDRA